MQETNRKKRNQNKRNQTKQNHTKPQTRFLRGIVCPCTFRTFEPTKKTKKPCGYGTVTVVLTNQSKFRRLLRFQIVKIIIFFHKTHGIICLVTSISTQYYIKNKKKFTLFSTPGPKITP